MVTIAEPVRDTDLCVCCGVIQSSLQGVAQTFREVLFQDQVQAVPPQLNGQNCKEDIIKQRSSVTVHRSYLSYYFLINRTLTTSHLLPQIMI